jgi:membrane-associated protein
MEFIGNALDWVLHFDRHLKEIVETHGSWAYAVLFVIVFCETGLVVTPFLPGDSLLFVAGALAADQGGLNVGAVIVVLLSAAILGDAVNYHAGQFLGYRLFREGRQSRWLKHEHLERTHTFFEKYGGKTIIIARFVPIVRTFAPFVAGMGSMSYARFLVFNVTGAVLWVVVLVMLGFWFGGLPAVEHNFTLVVLAIIVISLIPPVLEVVRARRKKKRRTCAPGPDARA